MSWVPFHCEPPGRSGGFSNLRPYIAGDCLAGGQANPIQSALRIRPVTVMASLTIISGTLGTLRYWKRPPALQLNLMAALHYRLLEKEG